MGKYLAIDPGESAGIALFGEQGNVQYYQTVKADGLIDVIEKLAETEEISTVIIEDYLVFSGKEKQHRFDKLITAKQIGEVKNYCRFAKIKFHTVLPKDKHSAYKMSGIKPLPKTNPENHALDAVMLGRFWLLKQGILKASDLL